MSDLSDTESENEDDQDRMRDMLASYYGMAKPEEGEAAAPSPSVPRTGGGCHTSNSQQRRPGTGVVGRNGFGGGRGGGPDSGQPQWQIDSPSFQADEYVKHLLKTAPMDTLLRRDDELVSEVKALDSDMQMLVYENYNKFISATDTIRKMKGDVESMEAEVDSLVQKMDGIAHASLGVNETLAGKRSRIDKLVRVRRLLTRLEVIFNLPAKLTAAVEKGDYEAAVGHYATCESVLRKYSNTPSFANIQVEARAIVRSMQSKLVDQLQGLNSVEPPHVVTAYAKLLLGLQVPPSILRKALVRSCRHHFGSALEQAEVKGKNATTTAAANRSTRLKSKKEKNPRLGRGSKTFLTSRLTSGADDDGEDDGGGGGGGGEEGDGDDGDREEGGADGGEDGEGVEASVSHLSLVERKVALLNGSFVGGFGDALQSFKELFLSDAAAAAMTRGGAVSVAGGGDQDGEGGSGGGSDDALSASALVEREAAVKAELEAAAVDLASLVEDIGTAYLSAARRIFEMNSDKDDDDDDDENGDENADDLKQLTASAAVAAAAKEEGTAVAVATKGSTAPASPFKDKEPNAAKVKASVSALSLVMLGAKSLHPHSKRANLADRAMELVEFVVRSEIERAFSWLRQDILGHLACLFHTPRHASPSSSSASASSTAGSFTSSAPGGPDEEPGGDVDDDDADKEEEEGDGAGTGKEKVEEGEELPGGMRQSDPAFASASAGVHQSEAAEALALVASLAAEAESAGEGAVTELAAAATAVPGLVGGSVVNVPELILASLSNVLRAIQPLLRGVGLVGSKAGSGGDHGGDSQDRDLKSLACGLVFNHTWLLVAWVAEALESLCGVTLRPQPLLVVALTRVEGNDDGLEGDQGEEDEEDEEEGALGEDGGDSGSCRSGAHAAGGGGGGGGGVSRRRGLSGGLPLGVSPLNPQLVGASSGLAVPTLTSLLQTASASASASVSASAEAAAEAVAAEVLTPPPSFVLSCACLCKNLGPLQPAQPFHAVTNSSEGLVSGADGLLHKFSLAGFDAAKNNDGDHGGGYDDGSYGASGGHHHHQQHHDVTTDLLVLGADAGLERHLWGASQRLLQQYIEAVGSSLSLPVVTSVRGDVSKPTGTGQGTTAEEVRPAVLELAASLDACALQIATALGDALTMYHHSNNTNSTSSGSRSTAAATTAASGGGGLEAFLEEAGNSSSGCGGGSHRGSSSTSLQKALGFDGAALARGTDRDQMRRMMNQQSMTGGAKSASQLDIEKAFSEAVVVFPPCVHPSHLHGQHEAYGGGGGSAVSGSRRSSGGGGGGGVGGGQGGGAFMPGVGEGLPFSVPSVLGSVLKVVLKAMVEVVRQLPPLRTALPYQQLQLDVQFLRVLVAYFLVGGGSCCGGGIDTATSAAMKTACDSLLDEVLLSAGSRCVDDPSACAMPIPDLVAKSNAAVADLSLLSAC